MPQDQAREIEGLVRRIWKTQIKKDYNKCRVWEERVLQSAFYHYLREGMKNKKTLKDLVLYPEMRVRSLKDENLRIDLAIVETKCDIETSKQCEEKWKNTGSCITRLVAAFEFKHWDREYPEAVQTELRKIKKYFRGVYYADDNSRRSLEAELTYLGIILEKGPMPAREDVIRERDVFRNLRLLLAVDLGKKSEFRYMGPSEDE
jgi:hypothetical protein